MSGAIDDALVAAELARWGAKALVPPGWDAHVRQLDDGKPDGPGWMVLDWRVSPVLGSVFLWGRPPQEAP